MNRSSRRYCAVLAVIMAAGSGFGQIISTIAGGTGFVTGKPSELAMRPWAIAAGTNGDIYYTDRKLVYRQTRDGIVSVVAGNGAFAGSGDGGLATNAGFQSIGALAVDSGGNIYVSDLIPFDQGYLSVLRRIDGKTGIVTRVAGAAYYFRDTNGDGGPATNALLSDRLILGIAVDNNGTIFIADTLFAEIRKVTPDGKIQAVLSDPDNPPVGLTLDRDGSIYFTDTHNALRKLPVGSYTATYLTMSGNGGYKGDGGPAAMAVLDGPVGIATDAAGNVYVADSHNNVVRKIAANTLTISVVAGTPPGPGSAGFAGDGGQATNGKLLFPSGVAVDATGSLFIADTGNNRIRKVDRSGVLSTTSGTGAAEVNPDGSASLTLHLNLPESVAVDSAGNVYIADTLNFRVLRVDPTSGITSVVAGIHQQGKGGDGGPARNAQLLVPHGLATDHDGNLYISDAGVRRVDAKTGIITNISALAQIPINPNGTVADSFENIFVADNYSRIDRIAPNVRSVQVAAGTGQDGFGDGSADMARFNRPAALAYDSHGRLLIADTGNYAVRKLDAGKVSTIAGGHYGFSGDGGPATGASLSTINGIAIDGSDNIYIADTNSHRIRRIDAITQEITTAFGSGSPGSAGDGGLAAKAQLFAPMNIAFDQAGNLYVADSYNNRIRKITMHVDPLGITSASQLPGGTVNSGYTFVFGATGGVFPFRDWTVTNGTLPTGLVLNPLTGMLAGTAAVAGTFSFTIQAADSAGGMSQKSFKIEIAPAPPTITISSVFNAASGAPNIAPNTWISIQGSNLSQTTRAWQASDFASGKLPTQLDGVSVNVNGRQAYVYYVSPTQLNVLTPLDDASGSVPVQVTNRFGISVSFFVDLRSYSPAFFTFSDGRHIAATHADGSLIGPIGLYQGATTPAHRNEMVIFYGNGFGQTNPAIQDGLVVTQPGVLASLPVIRIGGQIADIIFAGLTASGEYQFNVTIPLGLPDGDVDLTGNFNGLTTQRGVVLTLQN